MSMTTINMTCPRCGSADIAPSMDSELAPLWEADEDISPAAISGTRWDCLREDRTFTATPCVCGSYRFEGSHGTSGAPYIAPRDGSECRDCGHVTPSSTFA